MPVRNSKHFLYCTSCACSRSVSLSLSLSLCFFAPAQCLRQIGMQKSQSQRQSNSPPQTPPLPSSFAREHWTIAILPAHSVSLSQHRVRAISFRRSLIYQARYSIHFFCPMGGCVHLWALRSDSSSFFFFKQSISKSVLF